MHILTLNDDEALVNYVQPIVNKPRANMVYVDSDFRAKPVKAKIADAERNASTQCSSSAVESTCARPKAKEFVEPRGILWIIALLADNKTDTLISS